MQPSKLPKFLYKFRHFESPDHLRLLKDNEVFFASPVQFNDPFDCRIPASYHLASKEEMIEHWTKIFEINEPQMSPEDHKNSAEMVVRSGNLTSAEGIKRNSELTLGLLAKAFGICSTSAALSDILLWSHYSFAHSGFAVGFATKYLEAFCAQTMFTQDRMMYPLKVEYSHLYPRINAYKNSNNERFKMQVLTKATDWSYEEEYRIVLQQGANTPIQFPKGIIRRVILGCESKTENKNQIIEILKNKGEDISLFQAIRSNTAFALCFKKINY